MSNECNEDGGLVIGPFMPTGETKFQAIARKIIGSDYFRAVYFVDLSRTLVSNDDLRLLQRFPDLRCVALNETEVDDAGLAQLLAIGTLRKVELKFTNVTERGLEVLSENLPKIEIDWESKNGGIIEKILSTLGDEFKTQETSALNLEIIVDP